MKYHKVMRAELKVDIYTGKECNEHKPYWNIYAEGDKEDDNTEDDLILSPKQFPPGTKVVVSMPVCPHCGRSPEACVCDFDWKDWAEDQYG